MSDDNEDVRQMTNTEFERAKRRMIQREIVGRQIVQHEIETRRATERLREKFPDQLKPFNPNKHKEQD